jgi:Plasma-membrane choline transporter
MYHYGFLEAGKNAHELFEKRGWTTIVSDDLIPNVLFLTSLVMGGLTGCFSYIMAQMYNITLISLPDPGISSFLLGAVLGLVVNSILFSVVSSSVNTVLVCFASSPFDFGRNHPELSAEMRAAWREVWPGALDINKLQHLPSMVNELDEIYGHDEVSPLI